MFNFKLVKNFTFIPKVIFCHLRTQALSSKQPIRGFTDLESSVLKLGSWLRKQRYKGVDVASGNPQKELSTTYSFSCMGWINLFKKYHVYEYEKEAKHCIQKILSMQTDGCWLFPYEFGDHPPNTVFACENFMTIKSLLYFYNELEQRKDIINSVIKALNSLVRDIGYDRNGCFFYSPERKKRVPNISSMASSIFSSVFKITQNRDYLKKAELFAKYCLKNQLESGGFKYFEGSNLVVIPYHALEIWELLEANKNLNNKRIDRGTRRGMDYLKKQISQNHYASFDKRRRRERILFKTPLWCSKAFILDGNFADALRHYTSALTFFGVSRKPYYAYFRDELTLWKKHKLSCLDQKSIFMRYNASAFEIGSYILRSPEGSKIAREQS